MNNVIKLLVTLLKQMHFNRLAGWKNEQLYEFIIVIKYKLS